MLKKVAISKIGKVVSGATPKTADEENYGGDIPWLTPADLSGFESKYIEKGTRNITRKGYESCSTQLMPAGTVLFSSRAPIGYVAIAANPICTNQGFKSVVPDECIDSEFLYYQLKYLKNKIADLGRGTTFKEISGKILESVEIVVPEKNEQKRIVNRIEDLFSELDSAVETLKKTKEQLAVYRQAVLKDSFENQKDAKTVSISEITDCIKIGPFGTMLHKEDYVTDGVPVVNPQHIKNGKIVPSSKVSITKQKSDELKSYQLRTNDVVMGRRGEMGRCASVSEKENGWLCGTGSILFRMKKEFDAEFYSKILSSPNVVRYLEENATGTTMKNLNEDIVKNIPVPFMTKLMQQKVYEKIESQLTMCDNINRTVNEALSQADAMRQSILKKAFEGNL